MRLQNIGKESLGRNNSMLLRRRGVGTMRKLRAQLGKMIRRCSMYMKLTISFSIAIISILMIVMIVLSHLVNYNDREKILFSANQSFEQTNSFIQNYLDTMVYVSDQIYYNHDVQELLKLNSSGEERQLGEQYRDFLRLDSVLRTAELVETIYMARLFVPDRLTYSNNMRHFEKVSALENREDYGELPRNGDYSFFTVPEKIIMPGTNYEVEVVSLLRLILTTDGTIQPIGVEQIGIQTYKIKSVLEKSKITKSGIVYLVNSEGQLISCSDENHSLLQELRQKSGTLDFSAKGSWNEISLLGDGYYVNKTYLDTADWSLIALIPQGEILQQSRQLQSIIFVLTLVAIIAVFLVSNRISRYYTSRLSYLTEIMRKVPNGTLELDLETEELDEIGELFRSFSNMTRQLDLLMEEKYKSGKAVKAAQLQALRAQINPHFLYNTLDLINWEAIDHNVPEISQITKSLSRFYRISLNKGMEIVTIEQELNHVQAYVTIQNYHFDGMIRLHLDVPEEIRQYSCINIIIQPIVENSIIHGMGETPCDREYPIYISASLENGDIVLTVRDEGIGMSGEQIKDILNSKSSRDTGYGIKNIDLRLKLNYGEQYGLSYESELGKGTTARLRIPACKEGKEENFSSQKEGPENP